MSEAIPSVRVIVVEDDPNMGAAIVHGLSEANGVRYETCHFRTLHAALDGLSAKPYDAAVVDLGLPDSAGPDSALKIREAAPNMAVVALTGEDFEAYGELLARNGIQDYLQKGEVTVRSLDRALRLALERQRLTDDVLLRAVRDPLTGLVNRGEFERRLLRALHRADRRGDRVAVMIADLDNLKAVNDSEGHLMGDALITTAAQNARAALRAGDTVARWGGDEFTVILEGLTSRQSVKAAAGRLLEAFNPPATDSQQRRLSASIGAALFPDHALSPVSLLKLADIALYRAKHKGGSVLLWHDPDRKLIAS